MINSPTERQQEQRLCYPKLLPPTRAPSLQRVRFRASLVTALGVELIKAGSILRRHPPPRAPTWGRAPPRYAPAPPPAPARQLAPSVRPSQRVPRPLGSSIGARLRSCARGSAAAPLPALFVCLARSHPLIPRKQVHPIPPQINPPRPRSSGERGFFMGQKPCQGKISTFDYAY